MTSRQRRMVCAARRRIRAVTVALALALIPHGAHAEPTDWAAFAQQNWPAIAIGLAAGLALGELLRVAARLFHLGFMIVYVWGARAVRWALLMGMVGAAVYVLR